MATRLEARAYWAKASMEDARKRRLGLLPPKTPNPDPGPEIPCPTCGKPSPKLLTFGAGCKECRRKVQLEKAKATWERIEAANNLLQQQ